MHRIDGPGATVDNKFTEGDPVGGVQATVVTAPWLNDIQENLMAVLSAAGVSPTKNRAADLSDSIKKMTPGRLLRRTVYINNAGTLQSSVDGSAFSNASSTWTPHALTKSWSVEALGGGAGGGGCISTTAGQVAAGGGGGGGGYAKKFFTGTPTATTVSVGAGGTSPSGAAGVSGGTTSFGALLSATGGTAGAIGGAASPSNTFFSFAQGGIGSNGDINVRGGVGWGAFYSATALSGKGGSSMFGEGANPIGGSFPGIAAQSFGSGGSGGVLPASSGSTVNGGAGLGGLLIIEEYA